MATIDAIQVKNLRSLIDTGWIEQKPITILVGKNSAGKSTLARIFPLLKQSVRERKQSPILWFGQYVDFGQYSVAVHNKTPNASISFGFRLTLSSEEVERRNPSFLHRTLTSNEKDSTFPIEAEISLIKGSESSAVDTKAEKLTISILGFSVKIKFSNQSVDSLSIDGCQVWQAKSGYYCHVTFDSALPKFSFFKERITGLDEQEEVAGKVYLEEYDPYSEMLLNEIRRHVHGNLGDDKVRQIASRLTLAEGSFFLEQAISAGADQKMWVDYIKSINASSAPLRTLQRAVLCARLPEIFRLVDLAISAHFSAVRYIEPLRATAQRYYRKQDLAIGELDAKGANVAQFLQSLSSWRRSEFDAVTRRLFGFTVKPRAQGGHIELVLEQSKGGAVVNMADAGVGFSQILPILLQFWSADNSRSEHRTRISSGISTTLVVEQPELHLHPAYQATLADLFCETAAPRKDNRARVIAETHSAALVNRLGSLVADGKFKADEIQILLFEQDEKDGQTKIRTASFDDEGVLSNWPYGFFEPEA
jgi:energy-coupling factor transporter ATP-binding protein EcfA2